jgi:hypothetical protein
MPDGDAKHWKARMQATVAKLEAFRLGFDKALLRQLPRPRHIASPFNLPFPVFACEYCDIAKEVEAHVVEAQRHEVCRLSIASLALAVGFFRNNDGRNTRPPPRCLAGARSSHQESDFPMV